ncbi:MAG: leucine-rich repeat domain-containing protein [Bacteroidales bacterium]|nr:leucine-rich repeat domain-containing protein [Bacteroidales bacterium]
MSQNHFQEELQLSVIPLPNSYILPQLTTLDPFDFNELVSVELLVPHIGSLLKFIRKNAHLSIHDIVVYDELAHSTAVYIERNVGSKLITILKYIKRLLSEAGYNLKRKPLTQHLHLAKKELCNLVCVLQDPITREYKSQAVVIADNTFDPETEIGWVGSYYERMKISVVKMIGLAITLRCDLVTMLCDSETGELVTSPVIIFEQLRNNKIYSFKKKKSQSDCKKQNLSVIHPTKPFMFEKEMTIGKFRFKKTIQKLSFNMIGCIRPINGELVVIERISYSERVYFITEIGDDAFYNAKGITSVHFSQYIQRIGDGAFGKCEHITIINLPGRLTTIGNMAFAGCSRITSITLHKHLKNIGSRAFEGCIGLRQIISLNPIPPILTAEDTFAGVDYDTCELMIPQGSEDAYRETHEWNFFKNVRIINKNK